MTVRRTIPASLLTAGALACASWNATAHAQSSSLYGSPSERRPLSLAETSLTYQELPEPEQIQLYDTITIVVSEKQQVTTEGEFNGLQQARLDMRLQDWLRMDGIDLSPAQQPNGDPRVRGQLNSQNLTRAELETSEGMQFRITATIVDIRPNGHLVVEARRKLRNNNEEWEAYLTGVVNPDYILPNRTVLSERIAELDVYKRESGRVRDSYRRGWLLRIIDKVKPF